MIIISDLYLSDCKLQRNIPQTLNANNIFHFNIDSL